MWRTIWIFSALVLAVLILMRIGRYGYHSGAGGVEWILGGSALVFLFLGMGLQKLARPAPSAARADPKKVKQLGLTRREYEVLLSLCKGHSNREIARELFITESTVKTHVSNLLLKLEARRRTQLIGKARALNLIPQAPETG